MLDPAWLGHRWRMLCRRLLDARLSSLVNALAVALSYLQATITLMYLLLQVQFGWIIVLRAVGVSFFLFLLFICFVQGHLSMAW